MKKAELVSVHGGHSGQFCDHAADSLEEIINRYIDKGFAWVGITEHTPAISHALLDPGQRRAGLTPELLFDQFTAYMLECRRLQEKYRDEITIFAAMEIETYSGYEEFVPYLIENFRPDYIVGSVHFVGDIGFDYSAKQYRAAAEAAGGIDNLYLRYFDMQYEMIKLLRPSVVGHFDLIRIFDPHYTTRLALPKITQRIERNLALIKDLDLILDFNLRALVKGADEPYISRPILERARQLGIDVVPGDDSHGVSTVAAYMEEGMAILENLGCTTEWRRPELICH